ncbi:hypothetical protein AB0O31_21940 [Kitasatospora cineracea]
MAAVNVLVPDGLLIPGLVIADDVMVAGGSGYLALTEPFPFDLDPAVLRR